MKRISLISILIIQFFLKIDAQEATIFGVIRDGINNDPVEITSVYLEGSSNAVSSDVEGYYKISVPSNKPFDLIFSRTGYKQTKYHIEKLIPGEQHQINVSLAPVESKFEVEIRESRIHDMGAIKDDIRELKLLPLTSGNFESVLPSIALGTSTGTGGELSSQYNVRGGNYDENMVYVNDFEIFRPQLLQNSEQEGLSFPNPALIKNLSFSSGGFEAKYGDKMSSVLDIQYRRPVNTAASAEFSFLGLSSHFETSFKAGRNDWNKLNILTGVRYKDNRYLLSSQNKKGEYQPSFLDVQAYLTYNITKDLQIGYLGNINNNVYHLIPSSSVEAIGTYDVNIRFTTVLEGNELDKYKNGLNGLSLSYVPERKKNPLYLKLLGSYYSGIESQSYDIIGQYRLSQVESDFGKDEFGKEIALLGIGTQHKYTRDKLFSEVSIIKHLGGIELNSQHAQGHNSSHFLQWGVELYDMHFIDKINEWERLDSADYSLPYTDSIVAMKFFTKSSIDLPKSDYSAFISDTYYRKSVSSEFKTTIGVRYTYTCYNDKGFLSPRVQFSYKPLNWEKDFTFNIASGIYYQPPFYKEHRNSQGIINLNLDPQLSYHFVAGFNYDFYWTNISDKKFRLITELYYKKLEDMISYNYDNVRIIYDGENNSNGFIEGIDFRINGEFVPDAESWINVSIMKAREKLDGIQHKKYKDGEFINTDYVPLPTDRLVNASLFFQDYLRNNKNFKVHFNLNVGTGLPFGFKEANTVVRNNFRYSPYRRVDVGFSYLIWDRSMLDSKPFHPLHRFKSAWVSFEIFNMLDINNQSSVNWVRTITGGYFAIKNTLTSRRFNLRFKVEI